MAFDATLLFEKSSLVVCGKVEKIEPLGVKTSLSYPPLDGVVFSWLRVSIRVAVTLKGTHKDTVEVAMLSTDQRGIANGPGMVRPQMSMSYLLFLAPSSTAGVFVSMGAPYDEDTAILKLDRKSLATGFLSSIPTAQIQRLSEEDQLVMELTTADNQINMAGVSRVRGKYKKQISTKPAAIVIPLVWQKHTEANGWSRDVPAKAVNSIKAQK